MKQNDCPVSLCSRYCCLIRNLLPDGSGSSTQWIGLNVSFMTTFSLLKLYSLCMFSSDGSSHSTYLRIAM